MSILLSTAVTLLSFVLIGLFLIPVLIVYLVFVTVDGFQVASRLRSGYPVMKGECANTWTTFGIKKLGLVEGPVFSISDPKSCPPEWFERMKNHAEANTAL